MPLTREEFIAQHGYDPVVALDQQQQAEQPRSAVADFGRGLAVGAATAIPNIYAIPTYAVAAGTALFGDKPFLEGFEEGYMLPGARENIERHIGEQVQGWKEQAPGITDENLQELVGKYTKSKDFENFRNTQLRHGPSVAKTVEEGVRGLVGDTRPASERDWTDSAAEVIGGSLIGAPGGWVGAASKAAVGNAVARAAVTSLPGRTVIKGAELLTPLTIPYSGTNIALNMGVGIGVDQAIRALKGESTAFSKGSDQTDAGVGTLATIATAGGAMAAVIGATRGRLSTALQHSVTQQAVQGVSPASVPNAATPGGPAMVGGGARHEPVQSFMENEANWFQRAQKGFVQKFDEGAIPLHIMRQTRDAEEAKVFDAIFSNNTGAAQFDGAMNMSREATHEIKLARASFTPEDLAIIDNAMTKTALYDDIMARRNALNDEINALTQQLANTTGGGRASVQGKLTAAQNMMARHLADDPDLRIMKDIPFADIEPVARAWKAETRAELVAIRKAHENFASEMRDYMVQNGFITRAEANTLGQLYPNYVPRMQDPLHGLEGFSRFKEGVNVAAKDLLFSNRMSEHVPNMMVESEIVKTPNLKFTDWGGQPDTRVTAPLNPYTASQRYAAQLYRDAAMNQVRGRAIHIFSKDKGGNPSEMVNKGYMQLLDINGTTLFTEADVRSNPALRSALLEDRSWVPVWDGGRVEFWRFGDKEITSMLRHAPIMMYGVTKYGYIASSAFRANTTGAGAPEFAPINAMYDYSFGMPFRGPDRAFGPVDTMLRRALYKVGFGDAIPQHVLGRMVDPLGFPLMAWHAVRGMWDVSMYYGLNLVATHLARSGPIGAIAQAMGAQNFKAAVKSMLQQVADTYTMQLINKGVGHNFGLNDPAKAYGAFQAAAETVPASIRGAYGYAHDMISAIHMAPKRQFYWDNLSVLHTKYKGNIPDDEMQKLIADTRNMAGNVGRRAGSDTMQQIDMSMPYAAPIRAGALQMARSFDIDMKNPLNSPLSYTLPRLAFMMSGIAYTQYVMTHWDEEAMRAWRELPTWMRNRVVMVPTIPTMAAWSRGEEVPGKRENYYLFSVAPDLAPILAGTTAFMQATSMLPSIASTESGLEHATALIADALIPAMPPGLQALLAQSNLKLDPQGGSLRGGSWIRSSVAAFRKGPEAEALSNLGELSTSTALTLNALFGSNGGFLAKALETFQHASSFQPGVYKENMPVPRPAPDYAEGLRQATTQMLGAKTERIPDVPLVWKKAEKYQIGTPAWQFVTSNKYYIQSIGGMRNSVFGKAGPAARKTAVEAGGIPTSGLVDPVLKQISNEVFSYDRSGALGKLKQQYTTLSNAKRGLEVNYNLPVETRNQKLNAVVAKIQDNLQQQQYAIQYLEQVIGDKYGTALAPRLAGRDITMRTLDAMMRESIGVGAFSSPAPATVE